MNKINEINQRELARNVSDEASWHADYKDTAWIYIGGLHEQLAEKDLLTIFSQYGNPTHINLAKDSQGKSRGFAFLKYEDHRSAVVAVDNFNAVKIYEKPLKVDHTYYRLPQGAVLDDFKVEYPVFAAIEEKKRKQPKSEKKSEKPKNVDDDLSDPMAGFLSKTEKQPEKPKNVDDDFSDPMAGFLSK